MKVGVGAGVEVAVGLGEVTRVAEGAGAPGVEMTLAAGAGCDVQALNSARDRAIGTRSDFMHAIIAEAHHRVNVTKTGARDQSHPCVCHRLVQDQRSECLSVQISASDNTRSYNRTSSMTPSKA